jgi:hypothetical protein
MGQVNLYFAIGTLVQQDHVQHQNQGLINRSATVEQLNLKRSYTNPLITWNGIIGFTTIYIVTGICKRC